MTDDTHTESQKTQVVSEFLTRQENGLFDSDVAEPTSERAAEAGA
jgi:hypothetical protein